MGGENEDDDKFDMAVGALEEIMMGMSMSVSMFMFVLFSFCVYVCVFLFVFVLLCCMYV